MSASPARRLNLLTGRVSAEGIGRLALLTAALTVGLVAYGAWVRVSASGLGCPDWPLCDDSFVPTGRAAIIESGHRWYAGIVMLLLAANAYFSFLRRREFPFPSRIVMLSAGVILVQAVLGAVVVFTDLHPMVRLVHLTLALAIIAMLTLGGAGFLSRPGEQAPPSRGWHLLLAAAGVILVGGSIVATQSTFQCSGLPFCDSDSSMAASLHGTHRVLAVLLFLATAMLAVRQRKRGRTGPFFRIAATSSLLIAGQIIVGVSAVVADVPGELRILHVGLAALIWWALVGTWVLSAKNENAGLSTAA